MNGLAHLIYMILAGGALEDRLDLLREIGRNFSDTKRIKELLAELQTYNWLKGNGQYRDAEPKNATNHSLDALRYAVADGLNRASVYGLVTRLFLSGPRTHR